MLTLVRVSFFLIPDFSIHRNTTSDRNSEMNYGLFLFPKYIQEEVLSSIFRKIVSEKMKYCAGKPGEGAAKLRLIAEEHMPTALSRVPPQRHSSE